MSSPAEEWAATAQLLAGRARVRIGKRGRRDGQWTVEYPAGRERPLTKVLPGADPAAVLVYGLDGTCRTLCFDLDAGVAGVAAVDEDAARLERWLVECGARVITDRSPNGGRHVYVPLADRLPFDSARELVEALALMFATLDPGPHRSVRSGCIRTPGALHKSGGHQTLTCSLNHAYDVLRRPNGADVVQAMRIRLRPQIATWRARAARPARVEVVDVDEHTPAAPDGVAAGLRAPIVRIARHGTYDAAAYAGPSEAAAAVMAAAARAGMRLVDVVARIEDGRWAGLAALYAHHTARNRRHRITWDWTKATNLVARTKKTNPQVKPDEPGGNDTVRKSNTSGPESHGGVTGGGLDEHQFIRTWRKALTTTELHRFPGRGGMGVRFVLRALGGFAHAKGSRYIGIGTRSLAVAAGMDYSTVSRVLKVAQDGGWIDRLEVARGVKADLYALTLPADLVGRVEDLRWDKGKVHALRPAFREFGHVAALVFEAVEAGRGATVSEVSRTARMSRGAVHEAVEALLAWELLSRDQDGRLIAHPGRLGAVAEQVGALDAVAAQVRTYARQRAAWHDYLHRHDPEAAPADLDYSPTIDELAWLHTIWQPANDPTPDAWAITDAIVRIA